MRKFFTAFFVLFLVSSVLARGQASERETLNSARNFADTLATFEVATPYKNAESQKIRAAITDPMHLICPAAADNSCTIDFGAPPAEARYLMESFRASYIWLQAAPVSGDQRKFWDGFEPHVRDSWAAMRGILCRYSPQATYTTLVGAPESCSAH